MNDLFLPRLPISVKLLISAFLISMALNHVFAGWLTWEIANSAAGGAKEHFQYKTLVYLLKMSHQHAFGHGVMYASVGAIFLLCSWPERLKGVIVLLPFAGATADLASWWLMKYMAGDYEWLSVIGGTLLSLGFAVMMFRVLYEVWFWLLAGLFFLVVTQAEARPYYAAMKGISCVACHIAPAGGGMRKPTPESPGKMTDNVTMGADLPDFPHS